jgi:hypothetical protein
VFGDRQGESLFFRHGEKKKRFFLKETLAFFESICFPVLSNVPRGTSFNLKPAKNENKTT